jgi:hypothetical protein
VPGYQINLTGYADFVEVPDTVKGLDNVAHYIAQNLARKYARGVNAKNLSGAAQNWYDTHYDFIREELQNLANATRRELRLGRH